MTAHALFRYAQFNRSGNEEVAVHYHRKLIKRLATAKLHPVELNKKSQHHKQRKYGSDDNAVHYRLGETAHHVTVVPPTKELPASQIITYYKRED
jgi:hypothetical protein